MIFQEDSIHLGLAFIISVVSLFDEYVNELLYLRVGSCFPRYVRDPRPSCRLYMNDCPSEMFCPKIGNFTFH